MEKAPSDIPHILGRLPLFQELGNDQIRTVAAGVRERKLTRGEMLFNKGDPARGFFVVVSGQVKLAFPSAQGNEKVVEILGRHQSFGEAVMFMDKPYPVFAEALTDSTLLFIDRAVVFDLLAIDTSFARKLLAGLSQRLHGLVQDVESYSLRSSMQRVIGYLLQHCVHSDDKKGEIELVLPTSKQVMASRLNLTPETLSRVFHDLTERGLIRMNGRNILIVDADLLRQFDI